jgi:hypothetical protein
LGGALSKKGGALNKKGGAHNNALFFAQAGPSRRRADACVGRTLIAVGGGQDERGCGRGVGAADGRGIRPP